MRFEYENEEIFARVIRLFVSPFAVQSNRDEQKERWEETAEFGENFSAYIPFISVFQPRRVRDSRLATLIMTHLTVAKKRKAEHYPARSLNIV